MSWALLLILMSYDTIKNLCFWNSRILPQYIRLLHQNLVCHLHIHSGWDSCSVWCDFPSFCIGPGVLHYKSEPVVSSRCFFFQQSQVYNITVNNLSVLFQLRVVRAVAVLGGLLQIFLFMCLCGITASVCLTFWWEFIPAVQWFFCFYFN